jgi:hypothetical protein
MMRSQLGLAAVDVLALEYEQLKEEQRLRIGTRDNLLYATLGSHAVIAAGTVQTGNPQLLLLVAPVCLILGWTYFVNDNRITAIARYIEAVIVPALTARSEAGLPILAWERAHRTGPGRRGRKVWQAAIDLLTFNVSALIALGVLAMSGQMSPLVTVIAAVELVAGGLLGVQIVLHAVGRVRIRETTWSTY